MKPAIEYICPFVPAELISACGFTPDLKKLSSGDSLESDGGGSLRHIHNLSAGVCPVAESMLLEFSHTSAAGVIFSTTCDQMRRSHEIFSMVRPEIPAFLLDVPATWQDKKSFEYYLSELERLIKFLCDIGGHCPDKTELAEIMLCYARRRREITDNKIKGDSRINIALVGSELRRDDEWIFSYVREFGGEVVLDATCNGEMVLPACVLPPDFDENPLRVLAEMYFAIPHPHQRPDSRFFDYVKHQVAARNVQGVIAIRMSWCDTAHGFVRRLKQQLSVPLLEIAEADQSSAIAHMQSRICAFGEMLN